jgi:hypothetical protein
MHQGNIEWLKDLNVRYEHRLRDAALLELGSLSVNGSARDYLNVRSWTGVDKKPGEGVDVCCDAKATSFTCTFDVLLCLSMLEHDPKWRDSLDWNLQWINPHGLIILSWGAEGNQHHLPEPWKPVPHDDVWRWACANGHVMLDAFWESERFTADCEGCFNMVLVR